MRMRCFIIDADCIKMSIFMQTGACTIYGPHMISEMHCHM